ncbi:MAG: hypothetical protein H6834_17340 [Planctomycetes bacterium]|nr:hypothetical protein [Planctomycetota bacterium]
MDGADSEGSGSRFPIARPVVLEQPPPGFLPTRSSRAWLVEVGPGEAVVIHEEPLNPDEKLAIHSLGPEGNHVDVTATITADDSLSRQVHRTRLHLLESDAVDRLASTAAEPSGESPSEPSRTCGMVIASTERDQETTWFWLHDEGGDDVWLIGEDWLPVGARARLQRVTPDGLAEVLDAVVLDGEADHPFGCRLRVWIDLARTAPYTAARGFTLPDLPALG